MHVQPTRRYKLLLTLLCLMMLLGVGCKTIDCGCPMAYESQEINEDVPREKKALQPQLRSMQSSPHGPE